MVDRVERQVDSGVYPNRSEAIRQYVRDGLEDDEDAEDGRRQPFGVQAGRGD